MPTSRHATTVASVGGRVYLFGGGLTVGISVTAMDDIFVMKSQ